MPAQEVAFLFDSAVVWEMAGVDRDNEVTVLTPYEVRARWEAGPSTKVVDQAGQLVRTDGSVYIEEDLPLGSILWNGIIEDLASPPVDLFRIVATDHVIDIRGITTQRSYSLVRFHNTLPAIVGTG